MTENNKNPYFRALGKYKLLDGAYVLGNDVRIVCPFHNDTDPSLSISLVNGMAGCFGCSWRGNFNRIIKQVSGLDELKVMMMVEKLRKKGGKVPEVVVKEKGEVPDLSPLTYFKRFSRINWDAPAEMGNGRYKEYFAKRGVWIDTVKHFKVRVATRSAFPLVFPMMMRNKFIGFQSRRITEGSPKYIINYGFQRGKYVNEWGLIANKKILVVEGIIDFLKAWQYGVTNVVSLQGWRVSKTQANYINDFHPKEVVIATDADHTREDAIVEFERHFRKVSVLDFMGKKDIGEMSQREFKQCLRKHKERNKK